MSGLEQESGHAANAAHLNYHLPDDEKIYYLKNLNSRNLKILIDIYAFLEVVDIKRLDGDSDLAVYLRDQNVLLESFQQPEKFFDFLELEKRRLEDCIQKNLLEIKILQRNKKYAHKKKHKVFDERLQSILTEEQFMIIFDKLESMDFLSKQQIGDIRTIIKCSDTAVHFNPEAFRNNKIRINGSAIQFSVIWYWMITKKFITVDENIKFAYANHFFRNKNNLPFKDLRKSYNNYLNKNKTYPELDLLFKAILREIFPVS